MNRAGELLATVVGQDLDETDGVFRIARRVATDRVISTVDPDARHGRKTSARGFDGNKGHLAVDPDSEIITATEASAASSGDADPVEDLLTGTCAHRSMTITTVPVVGAAVARPTRKALPRNSWRSTVMPPMAPASCWPPWRPPA